MGVLFTLLITSYDKMLQLSIEVDTRGMVYGDHSFLKIKFQDIPGHLFNFFTTPMLKIPGQFQDIGKNLNFSGHFRTKNNSLELSPPVSTIRDK